MRQGAPLWTRQLRLEAEPGRGELSPCGGSRPDSPRRATCRHPVVLRLVVRTLACSLSSVLTMEQAVLRLLVEQDRVPFAVLSWIVTGTWAEEAMPPRCDVSSPERDGPQPF